MRRASRLFEQIIDRENLRIAVHKALRGKRSRDDARAFVARLDENLDAAPVFVTRRHRGSRGIASIHHSRPQGASRHGPLLSRTRPAPRDHERLRAGVRALADPGHVRLPQGQGTPGRARSGATVRRRPSVLPQARCPKILRQRAARRSVSPPRSSDQGPAIAVPASPDHWQLLDDAQAGGCRSGA